MAYGTLLLFLNWSYYDMTLIIVFYHFYILLLYFAISEILIVNIDHES